jgi:hypothetical protein
MWTLDYNHIFDYYNKPYGEAVFSPRLRYSVGGWVALGIGCGVGNLKSLLKEDQKPSMVKSVDKKMHVRPHREKIQA